MAGILGKGHVNLQANIPAPQVSNNSTGAYVHSVNMQSTSTLAFRRQLSE